MLGPAQYCPASRTPSCAAYLRARARRVANVLTGEDRGVEIQAEAPEVLDLWRYAAITDGRCVTHRDTGYQI